MKPAKGKKESQLCGCDPRGACWWLALVLWDKKLRLCAQSFFSSSKNSSSSTLPPLIGSRLKKKSQNKNQINASTLNVKVSEMEKPFQLLDVQENMNTC